ncbi:MAG: 50S ribosomal protein L17 [Candidatus Kapabacteria bacterium]|nr:50S ribosomal protein L17 [Candidatus Kapabacteria bacterium]
MRHAVAGRKLKRTASHRRAMFRNMVTSLFEHKKIHTTEAKAKELRPIAEQLITKAKVALSREKQGLLADGAKVDVHSRRIVARYIMSDKIIKELFDAIAPAVESRPGGYCRIVKTGIRRGDAGRTAIIELVDWAAPIDGATSMKKRKPAKGKVKGKAVPQKASDKKAAELAVSIPAAVAQEVITEDLPVAEVIEEVVVDAIPEAISEPVAEDVPQAEAIVSDTLADSTSETPAN